MSEERQRIEGEAGSAPKKKQKEEAAKASKEAAAQEAAEEKAESTEEKPKPKRTRRKKKDESAVGSRQSAEVAKDEAAEEEAEAEAAEAEGEPEPEDAEAKPKGGARGGAAAAGRSRRSKRRTPGEAVTVRAKARYVRCAPRKARLVVDHIRGKSVEDARAILVNTPRAASRDVLKLLDSAIANAESNHELGSDELRVAKVFVDEGPTLKRYRPRALGRATRIRKRTSHMTIHLTNQDA
jgi:large subunit ribosomal protein L22